MSPNPLLRTSTKRCGRWALCLNLDHTLPRRLPKEVVDARNQRLYRAIDLSMKHESLPAELQAMQDPFKPYLQDMLKLVKLENAERAQLEAKSMYDRQLP